VAIKSGLPREAVRGRVIPGGVVGDGWLWRVGGMCCK